MQLDVQSLDFACVRCEHVIGPLADMVQRKTLRKSRYLCDSCCEFFQSFCRENIGALRQALEDKCGATLDAYARGESQPDGIHWRWASPFLGDKNDRIKAREKMITEKREAIIASLSGAIWDRYDDGEPPMNVSGWWGGDHADGVEAAICQIITPEWVEKFIEQVYERIPPKSACQSLVQAALDASDSSHDAANDWIDGLDLDEDIRALVYLRNGDKYNWLFTDIDEHPDSAWIYVGNDLPDDLRLALERIAVISDWEMREYRNGRSNPKRSVSL